METGVPEGPGLRTRAIPHLITTVGELRAAVADLMRDDVFVIDVETTSGIDEATGEKITSHNNEVLWVGLGSRGKVYLIPINHPLGYVTMPEHKVKRLPPDEERAVLKDGSLSKMKRTYRIPAQYSPKLQQLPPDVVFKELEPLLFSNKGKIGQNTKFDLISVSKYYGGQLPPGPYHDTIIVTHLLDENRITYDLKNVVMDWLDIHPSRRKKFYPNLGKEVETQPIDAIARYLAKDIRYTWLYWANQYPRLAKNGLQQAYDVEMELYGVLMEMECNGFRIDTTQLAVVAQELTQQIKAVEGRAWSIAGYQFPLSNLEMKRKLLFDPVADGGQGLKPLSHTDKGTPQLDKNMLEYYAERNELAAEMLEWSKLEKLRGTFVVGLTQHLHDGRIHTSFKHHGTVTGRLSASTPNLQQIPSRGDGSFIREMFVPEPGHMLVVADYDQIELRCAAYLSGDVNMINVFQYGRDIHAAAAAAMYEVALEDVTKEQRQAGKGQNFLTLYGGGPAKLARTAKVDLDTAEAFIKRYYAQFPHLEEWKEQLVVDAKKRGKTTDLLRYPPYVIIPPFDRRRRLIDLYHPERYPRFRAERQAVNAVVQGFASYVMKLALINLRQPLKDLNARMLVTVHDEIVVSSPILKALDVKEVLENVMGSVTLNGDPIIGPVPLVASAGMGASWKAAK